MMGLKIDYRAADMITVSNLKRYRKLLKRELENHREKGRWMHPMDVTSHENSIAALDIIIRDFSEE